MINIVVPPSQVGGAGTRPAARRAAARAARRAAASLAPSSPPHHPLPLWPHPSGAPPFTHSRMCHAHAPADHRHCGPVPRQAVAQAVAALPGLLPAARLHPGAHPRLHRGRRHRPEVGPGAAQLVILHACVTPGVGRGRGRGQTLGGLLEQRMQRACSVLPLDWACFAGLGLGCWALLLWNAKPQAQLRCARDSIAANMTFVHLPPVQAVRCVPAAGAGGRL